MLLVEEKRYKKCLLMGSAKILVLLINFIKIFQSIGLRSKKNHHNKVFLNNDKMFRIRTFSLNLLSTNL